MKNIVLHFLLFSLILSLTSCDLVEGIFKAGMWVGIITILLVLGLILWVLAKLRK